MAFNQGFQTKYILNPWGMLFHPVRVLLKVISILFKVCSACYEKIPKNVQKNSIRFQKNYYTPESMKAKFPSLSFTSKRIFQISHQKSIVRIILGHAKKKLNLTSPKWWEIQLITINFKWKAYSKHTLVWWHCALLQWACEKTFIWLPHTHLELKTYPCAKLFMYKGCLRPRNRE